MPKAILNKIPQALAFIRRVPGVTGGRVVRFCGLNIRDASGKHITSEATAFLTALEPRVQVRQPDPKMGLLHALFYDLDYVFPSRIEQPSQAPKLTITQGAPSYYEPPKSVQFRQAVKAEREEQPPEPRPRISIKVSKPVSIPIPVPIQEIPPVNESPRQPQRTQQEVRLALRTALQEAIASGQPFTVSGVISAANVSTSTSYKPAYKREIDAIKEAIRSIRLDPPAAPAELTPTPESPALDYFRQQHEASLEKLARLETELEAERLNCQAWSKMVELHSWVDRDGLLWVAKPQSDNSHR